MHRLGVNRYPMNIVFITLQVGEMSSFYMVINIRYWRIVSSSAVANLVSIFSQLSSLEQAPEIHYDLLDTFRPYSFLAYGR